jgi:hypothetical protein
LRVSGFDTSLIPDEGAFAEKAGKHSDFSEIERAAGGEENG